MKKFTVGFSSLSESSPFSVMVREGLQKAAAEVPEIELVTRDNNFDDALALEHAKEFSEIPVDLAIIYHINRQAQNSIYSTLFPIPIIAIDIPIDMASYFGVNNSQIGWDIGVALVNQIRNEWDGQVDRIIAVIESRIPDIIRDRTITTINHICQECSVSEHQLLLVNAAEDMTDLLDPVLERWEKHHHIVGLGYNSDTTMELLSAIKRHQQTENFLVAGQGMDHELMTELSLPGTPLVAATHFFPEEYGKHLVKLIQRQMRGERIPQRNYIEAELLLRQPVY